MLHVIVHSLFVLIRQLLGNSRLFCGCRSCSYCCCCNWSFSRCGLFLLLLGRLGCWFWLLVVLRSSSVWLQLGEWSVSGLLPVVVGLIVYIFHVVVHLAMVHWGGVLVLMRLHMVYGCQMTVNVWLEVQVPMQHVPMERLLVELMVLTATVVAMNHRWAVLFARIQDVLIWAFIFDNVVDEMLMV